MSARPSVSMRLVDTGLMSARRNIAVTAALAERHRRDRRDLLRLYLFPRAVLIGSGQRLTNLPKRSNMRTKRRLPLKCGSRR